jgi:hypothetical protein
MMASVGLFLLLLKIVWGSPCIDNYPYELDIGFYWASVNGVVDGNPQIEWTKSCIGAHAHSFDPTRPSLIGVHGLQSGSVEQNVRFLVNDTNDNILAAGVAAGWLSLGYNFGAFMWTQFADEPLSNFMRAQGKINATDYLSGMEYLYVDRRTLQLKPPADGPRKSVVDYMYEHYVDHFPLGETDREAGPGPWIYGHSLGSQVTVFFAEMVITNTGHVPQPILPSRIALLDPVFSGEAMPYFVGNLCGRDTSDVLGCYMQQILERGIAVELYRSSFINRCIFSSENNAPMVANSAAAALKFNEWGTQKDGYCWNSELLSHFNKGNINKLSNQLAQQHRSVVGWYLASFITPNPPRICIRKGDNRCDATRSLALSAAMPVEDVLEWSHHMVSSTDKAKACFYQFDDYASTRSVTPSDDLFFVDDCFRFNG